MTIRHRDSNAEIHAIIGNMPTLQDRLSFDNVLHSSKYY